MSHTRPQEFTSTKAPLETSLRYKKALQAKEVRKQRHEKIRPQSDWRNMK
jgi:hypothetical protein